MALRVGAPLPSLEGATRWFNEEITYEELRGHAVLIHFWSVSCPACLYNMDALQKWKSDYGANGLRLLGVHLPRTPEDHDVEWVEQAIKEHGITWPCAIDNESILGERFDTGTVWPYYFLFDAEGKMRSRAAGGVGLRLLENALRRSMQHLQPLAEGGG